jgi:hypothetical protein
MTGNNDGQPNARCSLWIPFLCVTLGAVLSGVVVYRVMERHYWNRWQLANREYKAAIAELSARTLARLRTGAIEDATFFLEDHMDAYLVGVPMGERYPETSYRCQHALAVAKAYRSHFAFPGGCSLHGDDLHFKHAPSLLDDVPLLSADHDWLDGAMRKVREMPVVGASSDAGTVPNAAPPEKTGHAPAED